MPWSQVIHPATFNAHPILFAYVGVIVAHHAEQATAAFRITEI
jgi:hypothetical protein